MKKIITFMLVCFYLQLPAQKHRLTNYSVALTTLHTDLPFGNFGTLFTKEFHPGFEIGSGFNWQAKQKHDWFQAFKFGYSYQRFVQNTLSLYSEFGYRYKFAKSFSADSRVGLGYLHAIPATEIFLLTEDGLYKKKKNFGRPQAMLSFSVGVNKRISTSGTSVFVDYQQRLQFPFIKSYVPLLPSNMVMAGAVFPLRAKSTSKK